MNRTSSRPGKFRTVVAVVGAAAVLVSGAGAIAEAAGAAKPLLLGKNNKATKTTKLTAKKGPALSLKSKKGPALKISSADLIANLNADQLDGKDSTVLDPSVTDYQLGPDNTTYPTGTAQQFLQISLPAGTYEMSMHGIYLSDAVCIVIDPALLSSPTPNYDHYWLGATNTTGEFIKDYNIVTLAAQTAVDFGCIYDSSNPVDAADSLEFHVRKVNTLIPGTGTPTTIGPKPANKLVQGLK